jgi:hypothetical protein
MHLDCGYMASDVTTTLVDSEIWQCMYSVFQVGSWFGLIRQREQIPRMSSGTEFVGKYGVMTTNKYKVFLKSDSLCMVYF